MPVTIEANGEKFEFDDNVTDAQISEALDEYFLNKGGDKEKSNAKSQAEKMFNSEIPLASNWREYTDPEVASEYDKLSKSSEGKKSEIGVSDALLGAADTGLTLGTAATTGTAGFLGGFAEGLYKDVTEGFEPGRAAKIAQKRSEQLTRTPKTQAGQEITKNLASALGALPPVLGTAPIGALSALKTKKFGDIKSTIKDVSQVIKSLDPVDAPAQLSKLQDVLPDSIKASPRAKRAIVAEMIRDGNPNTDMVTKQLDGMGNLVTNKTSTRALKILTKDIGEIDAKKTISALENMNPTNKAEVSKMLKIVDRGMKSGEFGDSNRPSDVLGDAVATRARDISKLNEKAGNDIGNIAKSTKKNVDINAPIADFEKSLTDMGVTFKVGDDGWITPDFSRSKFVGGSQKDMTVLINELKNGAPTFEQAHKLKRQIRDNVDYDSVGAGQLKGDSANLLKKLSSGIDDVLDNTSERYKKANEKFASTVELKDQFNKLVGKDIDIFGDMSAKALGGKAKRITSNATSRVPIIQLLTQSDEVLKQNGIRLKTDIGTLSHVTNQIEKAFKIAPQNSLKGNLVTAGVDVAEATTSPIATARGFGEYLSNLTKPDFNKKMRAFRSMVEQDNKK